MYRDGRSHLVYRSCGDSIIRCTVAERVARVIMIDEPIYYTRTHPAPLLA